jgi:hypothetical protein
MAAKQTSLKRFLKTMSEDDTRLEFEKLTLNLEMEATKKAAFEAHAPPNPKWPVGGPHKVHVECFRAICSNYKYALAMREEF